MCTEDTDLVIVMLEMCIVTSFIFAISITSLPFFPFEVAFLFKKGVLGQPEPLPNPWLHHYGESSWRDFGLGMFTAFYVKKKKHAHA